MFNIHWDHAHRPLQSFTLLAIVLIGFCIAVLRPAAFDNINDIGRIMVDLR